MVQTNMAVAFLLAFFLAGTAQGKVYDRCELARELKFVYKAGDIQVGIWVCLAANMANYNTGFVSRPDALGRRYHGLFQIIDKYWCSTSGIGEGCGHTCADYEDDWIADDYECAFKILHSYRPPALDGFKAWPMYQTHCTWNKARKYIDDCY